MPTESVVEDEIETKSVKHYDTNHDEHDIDDLESSSMASPLSQIPSEEDENFYRGSFFQGDQWLESSTEEMLDPEKVPLGSLSVDDVESIVGLMSAWVRRRSVEAAQVVEQLLKRIVDDMRAGNPQVHVSARLYTIVSSRLVVR